MTEQERDERLRVLADAAMSAGLPDAAALLDDLITVPGRDDAALKALLREDQLPRWRTMRWLMAPDARRSGRTTVMALAALAEADRKLNYPIPLWDHHEGDAPLRSSVMQGTIRELLKRLSEEDPNWGQKRFEYESRSGERSFALVPSALEQGAATPARHIRLIRVK